MASIPSEAPARPDSAVAVDGPGRPATRSGQAPAAQLGVAAVGLALIVVLAYAIFATQDLRMGVLLALGLSFGVALYHARFGFTSAWRRLVAVGQGEGLRAHALMLAVASLLFAPILAAGVGLFGQTPEANVSPLGVSVVVGAFLFGVGMQLGGACASGTLYTIGGGQSAIVLTLIAFVGGSVLGAWNWGFWTETMPNGPAVSMATSLGYGWALAITLGVLAAIAAATVLIARRRNPPPAEQPPSAGGLARILRAPGRCGSARSPWPL